MSDKELSIKLTLDDKEAVSKLGGALREIESQSRQSTDSLNLAWAGFASKLFVVQEALRPVIDFMKDAVVEAIKYEDAVGRLNYALKLQGYFSDDLSHRYQNLAESLRQSTRFSDDAILETMQTLATIGNVAPSQMEKVTKSVLDLATASKRDLESVTLAVAKATEGETTALKRMGIVIDENIPKSQKFAAALEEIQKKAGGAAQEDIKTAGGTVAQFGNAWHEATKEIGLFVTESSPVKGVLKAMEDALNHTAKSLKNLRSESEGERMKKNLEALRQTPDVKKFLQSRLEAERPSSEQNFLRSIMGSEEERAKASADLQRIREEIAQEQQAIQEKTRAREEELRLVQQTVDAVFNTEGLKLQAVISSTEEMKRIKAEQTIDFIDKEKKLLDEQIKSGNISLEQKKRIAEVEKALNEAKNKTMLEVEKARMKGTIDLALATADLTDAIAVATGKGSIKAVGIVLHAVVSAIEIAQTLMDSTLGPLGFLIGVIKFATIAVQTANAFSQLDAAEKALDAARGQSVQAVTNVQGLQTGTPFVERGGVFNVGERGPEQVFLPRGSAVAPNESGNTYHIQIVINNPVFTPDNLADEVVRTIGPRLSQFIDVERERL